VRVWHYQATPTTHTYSALLQSARTTLCMEPSPPYTDTLTDLAVLKAQYMKGKARGNPSNTTQVMLQM